MFCDIDTAARIERAEVDTIAAGTARCDDGLVLPLAGGVASYAGPDSPMNKIAGLGFGGVPSESDLADIEREFAARDTPVQAEVASLADPTICELLTARGYCSCHSRMFSGAPGPSPRTRGSGRHHGASQRDRRTDGVA